MSADDVSDLEVRPSIIRRDDFSYLLDSKTALFITKPRKATNRGLTGFGAGIALAAAAGVFWQRTNMGWAFALGFIGLYCAFWFVKSWIPGDTTGKEWVLLLGAGEMPVEIFRSADPDVFRAKRLEIEHALTTRKD